ncbi:salivary gland-expressed bHLH [Cochliomyia hominivorax]
MSDHLDEPLTHSESLTPQALLVQTSSSNADGSNSDLPTNYNSDNESEKPVLLELGVTSSVPSTTSDLTSIPYTSDYPLDVHMNSVYNINVPIPSHTYNTDPGIIYNNPYNELPSAPLHQLPLHATHPNVPIISVNNSPYTTHIPQTVYTWSTPNPVTSITPTEVNNKLPSSEIVPPPIYMSYRDAREHTISKEMNLSWKEKAQQSEKDYKKTACDRERTRMRDMNLAFDKLRAKLPISKPNGKKYSKIESLRIAINYINHLQKTLQDNTIDSSNQTAVEYLTEMNGRRRSHNALLYENHHKSNAYENGNEKFENLDESRSTWSDNYIPNSQDKWE